jgi:predicted ArsR family transcriptional regulator
MDELAPGLGDSQRVLLGLLKRRGPTTIVELEAAAGLARESVRDHLRSLVAAGLVERAGLRRAGPGRPAAVYRLSLRGERLFPQREPELLRDMASFLLGQHQEELLERFLAQRARAKRAHLAERLAGLEGAARAQALAAILHEEGFLAEVEPVAGGRWLLRLCHCPLRELVAVTRLPCRSELTMVEELLGQPLRREEFMPDGGSSCTYSFELPGAADGVEPASAEPPAGR